MSLWTPSGQHRSIARPLVRAALRGAPCARPTGLDPDAIDLEHLAEKERARLEAMASQVEDARR